MLLLSMGVIVLITFLLLFSAAARRLHDRGSSGWWIALPFSFLVFGLAGNAAFRALTPIIGSSFVLLLGATNLAYMASAVVLIVMLASQSEDGTNRFGPPQKEKVY
jgi:uncharacterized membrane protein YhaH (DUF805 family)